MMTESVLLGKRLNMATRARRRRLVAAVYTWLALCLVVWYYFYAISLYAYAKGLASLCLFLAFVPFIAFWAITGDMLARGDERETHRRDHAHFVAYRSVGFVTVAELFAVFQLGPHPIISAPGPMLRAVLDQLAHRGGDSSPVSLSHAAAGHPALDRTGHGYRRVSC